MRAYTNGLLFLLACAILLQAAQIDSTILFKVIYPDARLQNSRLYLRGDDCKLTWSKGILLNNTGPNEWTASLPCSLDKTISVKALLNDTVWMFGKNEVFKGNQQTVYIYPSFSPKSNPIVDKSNVISKILGNTRKCSLYLPPSFNDNTLKKYQVLLMHDGQNLFDNSKAAFGTAWLIQNSLTPLMAEGKMRQIIVVGIWNTPDRNNEYTYSYDKYYKFGGKGDLYLDFIDQELKPIIEKDWLINRTAGAYGIGGSSLGGLISCYGLYTRPRSYNKAICMSSSFWWNSQDFYNKVLSTQELIPGAQFYVDSGDSGPSQDGMNQTVKVYNEFSKIGYQPNKSLFYYLDKGGQHNEAYWGKRYPIPVQYLYP